MLCEAGRWCGKAPCALSLSRRCRSLFLLRCRTKASHPLPVSHVCTHTGLDSVKAVPLQRHVFHDRLWDCQLYETPFLQTTARAWEEALVPGVICVCLFKNMYQVIRGKSLVIIWKISCKCLFIIFLLKLKQNPFGPPDSSFSWILSEGQWIETLGVKIQERPCPGSNAAQGTQRTPQSKSARTQRTNSVSGALFFLHWLYYLPTWRLLLRSKEGCYALSYDSAQLTHFDVLM